MIVRMTEPAAATRPRVAFQATDLARRHREVIDAARSGRAIVRDKDGTALVMAPVADVERTDEIVELALDLIRAAAAVRQGPGAAVEAFGGLAWLSVLPEDAQKRFLDELTDAVLIAASGTSLRPVELLLGDWRATAEAWADPDIRATLLAEEAAPLPDAQL